MPSSSLLAKLPYPELMQERLRTFTMLDAIVNPDMRIFEWHPKWGRGETMGAYKDGSGNFFFAWFCKAGAVIRGFDHESKMSPFQHDPPKEWPELFTGLPKNLAAAKTEPAFALEEITFACWSTDATGDWEVSKTLKPARSGDGSQQLLSCFQYNFEKWANETWEQELDDEALSALWDGQPLSPAHLKALNPDFDAAMVKEEAKLCGFKLLAR